MKQATQQRKTTYGWVVLLAAVAASTLAAFVSQGLATPTPADARSKIFAQALVEATAGKHPELAGLEIATTPPDGHKCVTIAATDAKELGDTCDMGELHVMKTGKPVVEKEGDAYDVTLPFHVGGKIIGFIGMDYKLDQTEAGLLDRARAVAKEVEGQVPSKSKLFEPAS